MTTSPAYVRNARMDVLATNRLGAALFAPVLASPAQPANNARFLFLDPAGPRFYPDWERQAQDVVAMLRTEAGRTPHDKAQSNLIGELSTRSDHFRTWWAAHNVRFHRTGWTRRCRSRTWRARSGSSSRRARPGTSAWRRSTRRRPRSPSSASATPRRCRR
ncbi:MAG TPA: hypothetical protein VH478_19620 [Trebonia sp.]|nr:hypothetical protein [Trebonia sp.]